MIESVRVEDDYSKRAESVHELDGIAFANHSFREYSGINTSFALMLLSDGLEDRRRFLGRVGIERDHHAATIQFGNAHQDFRAEA